MNPHLYAAWRGHPRATSRRSATAFLAALAMVTLAVALTTASASAAPPPGFVGTQSWKDPSGTQFDKLKAAKSQTFRSQFAWTSVEPDAPTGTCRCIHKYHWGRYDRQFEMAAKRGIRVLPVLLGSPRWATSDVRWPPVKGKSADWKRQAFYDFAKAASQRYGPNGTFWQGKSFPSSVRARFWQVWNEPNLPNYWWNRVNAGEYAQFLRTTSAYLEKGDPSALTVSAGLPWTGKATLQPPAFLAKIFSITGTSAATDLVAIHPYARNPDLVMTGVRDIRATLNRSSARSRPIWITEFGWSTGGQNSPFIVSESTQAKYLRDTYRKLLGARSTYGIHGAIWFNLQDVNRGTAWYYKTGLLRSDGSTPKPSWKALRCVTSGGSFCT